MGELEDLFTSIADNIRVMTGKTAFIPAVNFPNEIGTITNETGGILNGTLSFINVPDASQVVDCAFYSYGFARSPVPSFFISLPNCLSIGKSAFGGLMSNLLGIYAPKTEYIGSGAFAFEYGDHKSEFSIASFPKCSFIGDSAFYCIEYLNTAFFPMLKTMGSNAFGRCSRLSNVNFDSLEEVPIRAFNSNAFSTINLPKCTAISSSAFYSCKQLLSVYLLGSQFCSMTGASVFYGANRASVFVPASMLDTYRTAVRWSSMSARIIGV